MVRILLIILFGTMLLILMTLKNTSYTGTYSLCLPLLQCGLVPYPDSPKLRFFPQLIPSGEGAHQDRVPTTHSFRDCHHYLPHPQPPMRATQQVLSPSPYPAQEAGNMGLFTVLFCS